MPPSTRGKATPAAVPDVASLCNALGPGRTMVSYVAFPSIPPLPPARSHSPAERTLMHSRLAKLDWAPTRIGEVSLRRRVDPTTKTEVYEVKLGDEYLMSSLFTVAEEELARLALAALPDAPLDVVVGGLGLGYTARTALTDDRVRSLIVVEALA